MDGIIVINKPLGCTSFDVVRWIKRTTGERRVGHAGTLDPYATGVLIVCLGEATKLVPYLMDGEKEYHATFCLGISTDTDDAAPEAQVIFTADPNVLQSVSDEQIQQSLCEFTGIVRQRPPAFSAVKVQGRALYTYARERSSLPEAADWIAQQTENKTRTIEISNIVIKKIHLPRIDCIICCSKGTYIRALARDLGMRLQVGGHLQLLHRTRVGAFSLEDSIPLRFQGDKIEGPPSLPLLPAYRAFTGGLQWNVDAVEAAWLRQGNQPRFHEWMNRIQHTTHLHSSYMSIFETNTRRLVAIVAKRGDIWKIERVFSGSC